MKSLVVRLCLFLNASTVFYSCKKEALPVHEAQEQSTFLKAKQEQKYNIFKGPQVAFGNGYVRSWIRINHLDQPDEIGVEISASALTGLPHDHLQAVLPLHQKARAITPFDHVGLNYHPNGHQPQGVFTVEHFDAHFYMMSLEERMAIPAVTSETLPIFNLAPPAGYLPAGHLPGG